jgi:hypothetical protein
VRLSPEAAARDFGASIGEPLRDATLRFAEVRPPGSRTLWRMRTTVETRNGSHPIDQRLTTHGDAVLTLHTLDGALELDASAGTITCDAPTESLRSQLVTTFGLPLLVQSGPVVILHACAAIPPDGGGAVVVCSSSGGGKSTLLVGLVSSGWYAMSEDICVVDLRSHEPLVWPGPPWVRTAGAVPGARARFVAGDKTAWDIADRRTQRAQALRRIVFMDPPGGDVPVIRDLETSDAIPRAAAHVMWLGDPAERARATFAATVRLAGRVPSAALRVPRSSDWTAAVERLLT